MIWWEMLGIAKQMCRAEQRQPWMWTLAVTDTLCLCRVTGYPYVNDRDLFSLFS